MSIPDFQRAEYIDATPQPVPSEVFVPATGAFPQAILYGLGGALLGSLIYAFVGLWIEIGFISILVGALVGQGMMKGSGGVGGRRYQISAVVLTYFAVSTAYALDVLWYSYRKGTPMSAPREAILFAVFVIAGPFLQLASSLGGGLLSLLILFFGMQSAWKTTAGGRIYAQARAPQPDGSLGLR